MSLDTGASFMDYLKSAFDTLSDSRISCSCAAGEAVRTSLAVDALGHHYVREMRVVSWSREPNGSTPCFVTCLALAHIRGRLERPLAPLQDGKETPGP